MRSFVLLASISTALLNSPSARAAIYQPTSCVCNVYTKARDGSLLIKPVEVYTTTDYARIQACNSGWFDGLRDPMIASNYTDCRSVKMSGPVKDDLDWTF